MEIKIKQSKQSKNSERAKNFAKNPARVIVGSFALIIAVGTLLLMLPISTKNGQGASFLDSLFTATSATCVTGLVVRDTFAYFTKFGHFIILLLIQLGGLGLVTITTFFTLMIRKKIGLKAIHLAQESVNSDNIASTKMLLQWIIKLTFSIEFIGAVILSFVFVPQFGSDGIFIAIFTSISAYCNAGFDLMGRLEQYSSLTSYHDNPVVLITVMFLIVIGGLGFVVWQDLYQYHKRKKLLLQTKIVLSATGILILFGTIVFAFIEWNNIGTIALMSTPEKILNSLFQSVTCRTAGFNTIDIASMDSSSKAFSIALMFIGAAPGSTGGGIKVTTLVVLVMTVVCALKGKSDTVIFKRKINIFVVYKAIAITAIGMFMVATCASIMSLTAHNGIQVSEIDALFESVSAFATVGLSSGVTGIANLASKIMLILTMFLGRVGVISIAFSVTLKSPENRKKIIPEGKLMVG